MNKVLLILAFIALTVSFDIQYDEFGEIQKPCQAAIDVYQKNLEYIKDSVEKKEFSVILALNFRLKYTLQQLSDYCPVIFDEQNQVKKYSNRKECAHSIQELFELSSQDIVSNFQQIFEIVEFQEQNCWSYDYAGKNLKEVIKDLENDENKLNQIKQIQSLWNLNSDNKKVGKNGGGVGCIVCTALLQAINDYVKTQGWTAQQAVEQQLACSAFPNILRQVCNDIFERVGDSWISMYNAGQNSDAMCSAFQVCTDPQCSLFGQQSFNNQIKSDYENYLNIQGGIAFLKAIGDINDIINKFADQHLPVLDLDNDYFSTKSTLRGWSWRGKDCNDLNKSIHPGRKTKTGLKGADYNCNGISGVTDSTGVPYKTEYCDKSQQMGVVVIGDSAGAHFSLPPNWLNGTSWDNNTFDGFWYKLSMELDNPNKSSGSGYEELVSVNSFYLNLLQRNRCNRNDYQNLGVNGARSGAVLKLQQAISRDQNNDHPVIVFWELIGNDVCSSIASHMTEPDQFKQNILDSWQWLDENLPAGSHMVVTGVADGTILYECLQDRESPTGVKYPQFYSFMNCLEISPCAGWMNEDAQTRQQTTERAKQLNKKYQEIIAEKQYKNFDIQYYDFPMDEIMLIVEEQGGQCWDCIEAGDGFHPSQVAVDLWADILWKKLDTDQPNWKGEVNPFNEQIKKQFGQETIFTKMTAKFDYRAQTIVELQ